MIGFTGLNSFAPTIFVAGMIWMFMVMFHLSYYIRDNYPKLSQKYSENIFGINALLLKIPNRKDEFLCKSIIHARLALFIMIIGLILVLS